MHALPPLRQELSLASSPSESDGSPAWTLYDPGAHRFYQLGWPAFEILSRWSLGSAEAVVAAVVRETTLNVDLQDVLSLAQFVASHQLTLGGTRADTERLLAIRARHRLSPAKWLLKHYLFMRAPLLRPMRLLKRLSPFTSWFYRPAFWWMTLIAAVLGVGLASRHWDEFVHTFGAYSDWRGLLWFAFALSFAKVLHEFGHALTAFRHGCNVPTMGIALLVLWPVLYTDTNEAWKLRSRRERLQIGAAGMLAELALAAYATLLWNFLPDGHVRAAVFLLATSTWIVTLTLNASPFTRFDGYFLLSDWLKLPNLHERAFALTRWWLRELLFGFGDEPPELFPTARRRFLIAFSIAAWTYRLLLFLGIALLVFHFFFRALGIVLMFVEIGWFIALPIAHECSEWWRRRGDLRWNTQTVRAAIVVAICAAIVFVPMRHPVASPAVLMSSEAQSMYAVHSGVIREMPVREGDIVLAGSVLARLYSPELEYEINATAAEEAALQWQLDQQPFDEELRKRGAALRKRWEMAHETLAGLQKQLEQLTVRAPFDGKIADVNPELRPDVWLKSGERLFTMVGRLGIRGEAFVDESRLHRIQTGTTADFISDIPERSSVRCSVGSIDRLNLSSLDSPYAASIYGGTIPSRKAANGEILPLESTFRVRFDSCQERGDIAREISGRVLLSGNPESYAAHALRSLMALLRREASV